MKSIVLAGGSGFLGRALQEYFRKAGWRVVVLTRRPTREGDVAWDGKSRGPWARELENAIAVINLSGKSVDCRYNAKNRAEILRSRVEPTRLIGKAIKQCAMRPKVWLNASTATLYKYTVGAAHDEEGEIGAEDFSISVGKAWEQALADSPAPKTRKVALRVTMVLGNAPNSVFPVLRRLTRLGLGGRMGSGQQFVSWIHEVDFCRAVEWIIAHDELKGHVNLAAPNPLTNAEMMRAFRKTFGAPIGLPAERWMLEVGAWVLRTETELILKSRRVVSSTLPASGFTFRFSEFQTALEDLAKKA